jgi:hypothetical protein
MSTNLKLGSFALLFTTSLLGAPAAMAGDAGLGDGHEQARRLLAGPHHTEANPALAAEPRITKAAAADAHDPSSTLSRLFAEVAGVVVGFLDFGAKV